MSGTTPPVRPPRRPIGPGRWGPAASRSISPLLTSLPGAPRRRRLLLAAGLAIGTWLLRPWPPFQWLPGWCVGVLLLWALIELVAWLLWPQRSV